MSGQNARALDLRIRPTRVEIDAAALRHNLAETTRLSRPAQLLAVVKANAYGHGAAIVARILERAGAQRFAVALVEEGIELREAGVRGPILVLGAAYDDAYEVLLTHDLTPVVFRDEHLIGLQRAASAAGRPVAAHLKIDTGMGRIGVTLEELDAFLDRARAQPAVQLDGLLSHFANADLADSTMTGEQIRRFRRGLEVMRAHGLAPTWRHLSNSAGVMELAEVRDGLELNLVRPGLMLYGLSPAEWLAPRADLRPVLTWKTAIIHLKEVAAGTPISYGSTWTAPRPSRIATLPLGYADGYSRLVSGRACMLVRGRRVPLVGRVCMDLCMIDVTDAPGVSMGDEVVVLGAQGSERIRAEELAAWAQTINYEVVCAVGARVPRVLVDESDPG